MSRHVVKKQQAADPRLHPSTLSTLTAHLQCDMMASLQGMAILTGHVEFGKRCCLPNSPYEVN